MGMIPSQSVIDKQNPLRRVTQKSRGEIDFCHLISNSTSHAWNLISLLPRSRLTIATGKMPLDGVKNIVLVSLTQFI